MPRAQGDITAQIHAHIVSLLRDGYVVIPGAAEDQMLAGLIHDLDGCFAKAPFCKGPFYGDRTKRFGRILGRSAYAAGFALNPMVIAIIERVLEAEGRVQLNLSQCIEIHPGAAVQPPHRDHDMWSFPKIHGKTHLINVMWALTDFTPTNGATRIWPKTHIDDWGLRLPSDDGVVDLSAPAGSAILFLGQTLHAGGANISGAPRRGLVFSYCLDWLLPHENPWLAYPPEVARSFSPELAALVGYRQRNGGLNNFEGQTPAVLLDPGRPGFMEFTDAMSPEHDALIEEYYRDRRRRDAA